MLVILRDLPFVDDTPEPRGAAQIQVVAVTWSTA